MCQAFGPDLASFPNRHNSKANKFFCFFTSFGPEQEQVKWYIFISSQTQLYPYSTFTITKVQLHVSAINVGHLQVIHEALNDKLYLHVSGEFTVCGVGWVRDLVLCL